MLIEKYFDYWREAPGFTMGPHTRSMPVTKRNKHEQEWPLPPTLVRSGAHLNNQHVVTGLHKQVCALYKGALWHLPLRRVHEGQPSARCHLCAIISHSYSNTSGVYLFHSRHTTYAYFGCDCEVSTRMVGDLQTKMTGWFELQTIF